MSFFQSCLQMLGSICLVYFSALCALLQLAYLHMKVETQGLFSLCITRQHISS